MSEPESLVEPCGWRYISNAKGAKWTVQKNRPTHIETWPGYTVEPIYPASALSTLRSRCETLEAERDEAFEQCAKIAEWDMRTPMAISAGHKPEWYKHGLSIAKRIRNLAGRATQPAGKEKG